MRKRRSPLVALLLTFALVLADAGSAATPPTHQVFLRRLAGADELIFVATADGVENRVAVSADRYTLIPDGVLLRDRTDNRVRVATPDGRLRDHPLMQPPSADARIDWIVAGDRLAWTITTRAEGQLLTETFVSDDGVSPRRVFVDLPRSAVRAFPLAFSADGATLYMDYQPDGIADASPLRQAAALFALDLATGETRTLPGEPGCFCAAGIAGGRLARAALTAERGFELRLIDLASGAVIAALPSPDLPGFTQTGDLHASPDGRSLVYTLARVQGLGSPTQTIETAVVRVDLAALTAELLIAPAERLLRFRTWAADGLPIYGDPLTGLTWRLRGDGTADVQVVAQGEYLGTISGVRP